MSQSITDLVKEVIDQRKAAGIEEYGEELTVEAEINFMDAAIEEAADMLIYLVGLRKKLGRAG